MSGVEHRPKRTIISKVRGYHGDKLDFRKAYVSPTVRLEHSSEVVVSVLRICRRISLCSL